MDWQLSAFLFCTFIFFYHHWIYPLLLKSYAKKIAIKQLPDDFVSRHYKHHDSDNDLPMMTIVMPVYNEQKFLADKLHNLLMLDYPSDKFRVVLGFDGCSDNSVEIAQQQQTAFKAQGIQLELIVNNDNQGKIATINELLERYQQCSEVLVLTDVSALVSVDALQIFALRMAEKNVGIVTGDYQLYEQGSAGEANYWRYQQEIRKAESLTGSVIGPPGALYAIKSELFEAIPVDTINDDFVFPMMLVSQGYRAVLDERVNIVEMEASEMGNDLSRRVRIGAGNLQQTLRLKKLLGLNQGMTSFNYFSGKFLRTFMPINLLALLTLSFMLTVNPILPVAQTATVVLYAQLFAYLLVGCGILFEVSPKKQPFAALYYLLAGYCASFYGLIRYSLKLHQGAWVKITSNQYTASYQNKHVIIAKRVSDICIAIVGLCIFLPLFPFIAVAIKMNTPGPVFYRQLRVGEIKHNYVEVFMLIKFRTMGLESESASGPVWATATDNRATGVGKFLRKTRLDEIPQLINVLLGNMAIVGPRPERPIFCGKLEQHIPYYLERTSGVRPGITGLAQVNQSADTCLEDVENKLYWDHAYALSLVNMSSWLKADIKIILQTFQTMVMSRGH